MIQPAVAKEGDVTAASRWRHQRHFIVREKILWIELERGRRLSWHVEGQTIRLLPFVVNVKQLDKHYAVAYSHRVKPKRKPERNVKVLGFQADAEMRTRIDQLAEEARRSRAWMIRELIVRAIAANEKTA